VSAFLGLLNRTLTVNGQTQTGEDGGGNPTYSTAAKGTVRGRIDPKVQPDEINGPDLNPVISEYLAITAIPSGFTINERDTITDGSTTYEVLGTATLDGRSVAHHLEIDLRRVAA
jgi:hypothetical protein